jgi:3-oxoacyl-[acyl-carrier-protein] synthase II
MSCSPACVVGYGMIDGLGNNPTDCFEKMIDDKDYSMDVNFMGDHKIQRGIPVDNSRIKLPDKFTPKITANMTRAQQLSIHATEQALQMSGLPLSKNVAVIVSSVSNDVEFLDGNFQKLKENKRVNPFKVVNRIPDIIASQICSHYGFMGASFALYASCATGMYSIDYAMRIVDEYDYVIVGGADAGVFEIAMKYFAAIGALGNINTPFDDKREGFVMGEGAGVLIFQSEKKAKEFNSTKYAKLYPVGTASDAFDLTSPANDGRGAKIAITKAIKNADIHDNMPIHIDAISAHATSTPIGDPIEYKVITDYFGPTPIYSPKSKIGHTLAASGILETIYAIKSMENKIIPHCQNLKTCSFDNHNCLVRKPTKFNCNQYKLMTLNNSFGFGGKCASQVIECIN